MVRPGVGHNVGRLDVGDRRPLGETADLDPRRILAAEIMGRIYKRLLARIEASGFDVFRREVRVPLYERAWIAGSAILAAHAQR